MSVTAVLITWKRQYNLPIIIEDLLKYDFIDEIMIRDNSKCKNIKCYARFTQARKAKNNIIYTQDDDCIVHNIQGIYDKFLGTGNLCYSGEEGYETKIEKATFGKRQIAMLGWGSMFLKDSINVLDRYIKIYGKDDCFYRETDRIFSLLQNQHHEFVSGGITNLKNKNDDSAMCNQPDHLTFKNLAIERCLKIK